MSRLPAFCEMKLLDFTAVRLTLSLIPGIILGWLMPLKPEWVLITLSASLIFLFLTFQFENYRYGSLFGWAVLSTSACLGALAITLAQPTLRPDHYSHNFSEGNSLWEIRVKEVLRPSSFYNSFILEVKAVDGTVRSGRLLGRQKRSGNITYEVDDRILFYGIPEPIHPPANPHQFNFRSYMKTMGICDQVRLGEFNYIRIPAEATSLTGRARRLRNRMKEALQRSFPRKDELGVLMAILLGDRNDLSPEVYRQYRDAGAAHILAVSGLHVGILLLLLRILLKPLLALKKGRQLAMVIAIIAIWAYAFFTGLSPSVVRAATVFSFLSYTLFLSRPANTLNIIFLSAFAILLFKPEFLFQVGFQLSYAAVLSIAWVYPILLRIWHPKNKIVKRLWRLVAVSLAAQIGVLPLCLHYFHQFPGLFLISAIILLPGLGFLLGSGVIVVVLGSLDRLPEWLALAYSQMIKIMNTAVEIIAAQETFVLRGITLKPLEVILLFFVLIFLVLTLQKPRFRHMCALGGAICLLQISVLYQRYRQVQTREVYLLHRVAHSGLLYQHGPDLQLYSDDPYDLQAVMENFRVHKRLKPYARRAFPRAFSVEGRVWIVMDSTGILPPVTGELFGLILTQSPEVHLGRILEQARPQKVVADGSNFRQDVVRWKETCRGYGIPFYSTTDSGALKLIAL